MTDQRAKYRARIDPSQEPFEIAEWPFYHLVRLTAAYTQRMDASLKPLGIDVPRWRVLTILDKQGTARITELADEAVTKMSTMAKIVQRMTLEDLVEVQPSKTDARATEVILAARGREILQQVQAKVGLIGRLAFEGVSDQEIRQLNAVSKRIYDNLQT